MPYDPRTQTVNGAPVEALDPAAPAMDEVVDNIEIHELLIPVAARMVVMKPRGTSMTKARRLKSGLVAPARSEWLSREYGIICRVVRVGPEVQEYVPGDTVLIAQFGGLPVMVAETDVEVWIVQASDILARVDPTFWDLIEGHTTAPESSISPASGIIPTGDARGNAPVALMPGTSGGSPLDVEVMP